MQAPSPLMEPPYFPEFQLAKDRWQDLTAHLFSLTQRQKEKYKKENGGELTRRTQKELGKSFGEGTLLFLKLVQGEDSWGCKSLTLAALTTENHQVSTLPPPMQAMAGP